MTVRQILRKPAFMILFALLLALSSALLCVGTGLWAGALESIREADGLFTTVAVLNEAQFRQMKSNEYQSVYAPELYDAALRAGGESRYARLTDDRQSLMGYAQSASGVLPSDRKNTGIDFMPSAATPYAPSVLIAKCVNIERSNDTIYGSSSQAAYLATFEIAHEASPAIHPGYSDIARLKMVCEQMFPDGSTIFQENKTYLLYTSSMEIRAKFDGGSYTEIGDETAHAIFGFSGNMRSEVGVLELYGWDWADNSWFDWHEYDLEKREIGRRLGRDEYPGDFDSRVEVMQEGALEKMPFVELKDGMGLEEVYAGRYGEMWLRIVEQCRISQHSFEVYKTSALYSVLPFNQQSVSFLSGRGFSAEEYAAGARVCVVSAQFALANGLKEGDTLEMGFYNSGYLNSDDYSGDVFYPQKYTLQVERSEELTAFEIIGVYSSPGWGEDYFSFTPNTVFVPAASIPEDYPGPVAEEGKHNYLKVAPERPGMVSVVLENGSVNAFEAEMEAAGYGGMYYYFDQGYSNIAGTLSSMAGNAGLLMAISGLAWLAVTALYLVLAAHRVKLELGIMALLGAGPRRMRIRGFKAVALTVAAACVLGAAAGTAAYGAAAEEAYAFSKKQGESNLTFSDLPAKSNLSQSVWEGSGRKPAVNLTDQFEMREAPNAAAIAAAVQLAVLLALGYAVMAGVSRKRPLELLSGTAKARKVKTRGALKQLGGAAAGSAPPAPSVGAVSLGNGLTSSYGSAKNAGINAKLAFQYTFKHMLRSGLRCLSLLAVSLVFALLLCELGYAKESKAEALKAMYRDIEVKCVVSDLTGTKSDGLMISVTHIDILTSKDYTLWEYVKDLRVKRSVPYALSEAEIGAVKANYWAWAKKLTGISRWDADPSLTPEKGVKIVYFEGYDETVFETGEAACVVPAKLYEEAGGGTLSLTVVEDLGNGEYGTAHAELNVAGTYTGTGESEEIYCPWETLRKLTEEAGGMPYMESLSFSIADNLKLDQFKQKAAQYYTSASLSPGESEYNFALTVFDGKLIESTTAAGRELRLLELLMPLLLVLSAGAGFTASYLFIRNRKAEFGVMRSLGTRRAQVFFTAFSEQFILGAFGAAFGAALYIAMRGVEASPGTPSIILYMCGYLLGAGIAVAKLTGVQVMEHLKAKE